MVADGWINYKLGDICEFTQGIQIPYSEQKQEYTNGYIRYLYIRDFFSDKDMCFVKDIYPHKIMSKTDIMMVNTGNTAGRVYSGAKGVLSNNAFKFDFDRNVLNRDFLFQFLTSHILEAHIKQLFNTAGQPHIGHKNVALVPLVLPPLKEQEKIADILSTADEKIDAIEGQIQKAETLKKGLLQKLLSEGIGHSEFKDSELGKIPESWEVVEFGKHLDVKSGFGFKAADYSQSGIPLVKIDNVSYGNIIWENTTYLPTEFAQKYQELVLSKDDILLALNRPITQNKLKMAILKEKDAPSILYQRVGKILFDETYYYKFTYYMLYRYVYDFVIHHSVGTDQPFINITKIRKLLIPLPPLKEQKQIAEILSTADEKLEVLGAKKQMYETLKKGLLQKLLSGEVRV